jgi:hypothetical protein
MPTTPPPLDFDHLPGFEIATKHKNAIRELYGFGRKTTEELMARYKLTKLSIHIAQMPPTAYYGGRDGDNGARGMG